jgi:hypothetical protein
VSAHAGRRIGGLGRRLALLQGDEAHPGHLGQRRQRRQAPWIGGRRWPPVPASRCPRLAGPDQPDLEARQGGQALAPGRAAPPDRRRGRAWPGNGRERRSRRRAAGSAAGSGDRREAGLAAPGDRPGATPGMRESSLASGAWTSRTTLAPGLDQRRIAAELQGVAQALFGVQQDGPLADRLAAPQRDREVRRPAPCAWPSSATRAPPSPPRSGR